MRRLILRSFQSPGDIVMLTAAIRDLHAANPGQFETDVRTSADALFENSPRITRLSETMPGVEQIDMHYSSISATIGHTISFTVTPNTLKNGWGCASLFPDSPGIFT
jgi:ADP-heptose:LPS heptosyltransferase